MPVRNVTQGVILTLPRQVGVHDEFVICLCMEGHHEEASYAEAFSSYSRCGSLGDIIERALVQWRCGPGGGTVGTARRGQDGCERPHSCRLRQRHSENAGLAEQQPPELGLPGG